MEGGNLRASEKKEINILVGENIRFYREKLNISREKLAELVGITPRFLADAELGFVGVSLTNIKKICEVLGISADRLLWEEKTEKVELSEQLSHIPPQYLDKVQELLLKQLEILALADQSTKKKTRS
ncbi:XRE family transcriptional regulator [Ruminococcaceae bacterium AM07-15]|nr:XRE family transcriptional regulator [Ruminococcaceae bacterium AM07-15]